MLQIKLDTTFTIKKDETVIIDNSLFFTFNGHSHKMVYENSTSPLMINIKYRKELPQKEKEVEKTYYMYEKPPFMWRWGNYLFVVIRYEYDEMMEMKICQDNFQE